jgi:uncharacterized protein (DUF362 family)
MKKKSDLKKNSSILFVQGVKKDCSDEELAAGIKKVFLGSTDDLSWLSKGDTVLLKPALNSPDPYPSTTHPLSLRVVVEVLKERGAKVIVADQSGIEHVLHDSSGVVHGSSKICYEKSGMSGSGIDFIALESRGWDSFYNFKPGGKSAWKDGFYITDLIKEVDHIILLPRVSTHIQAGVTLGFKSLVGLLREDSRVEFHNDGAYSFAINFMARKGNLRTDYKDEDLFFEKVTEISLALKEKLRLTLFTATEAQVTLGPDRRIVPLFRSYVARPDTGLVFASSDIVATEVFSIALLTHLRSMVPLCHKLVQKLLMSFNSKAVDLGKVDVWENPFVENGLRLGLGRGDFKIVYSDVPADMKEGIDDMIY